MKYAVIQLGQKQYLIEEGSVIELDKQPQDEGKSIKFNEVLLFVDGDTVKVGTPTLKYVVEGKVVSHIRDKKKVAMKYKPGGYRRKFGHKQPKTLVEIKSIKEVK